ncbi:hypothetical protein QW131_14900 [Roseibium salinum]|nr:hypothetical protein [Roseibium salinum]
MVLIIGGVLYANGYFGTGDSVSIEMNAPSTDSGTAPAGDTDSGSGTGVEPAAPEPAAPEPATPADGQ